MIAKLKTRRFNRSVRRLHKQGVRNMVEAYDLYAAAYRTLNK